MATPHRSRVPPHPTGIVPREYAHVVFRTAQPDVLIDWYCTVLNMQVVVRHSIINFLTWDDSQDRLAILNDPSVKPRPAGVAGLDHVAFSIGSIADLTAIYRRLKGLGIMPYRMMNHGVASSMYYRDPDGNQIELTVANFATVEAMNDWLATGDFDENPIGVPADLEALCHRVDAGESEESLRLPHPEHRTWLRDHPR